MSADPSPSAAAAPAAACTDEVGRARANGARLWLALVASVTLHAVLVFGYVPKPGGGGRAGEGRLTVQASVRPVVAPASEPKRETSEARDERPSESPRRVPPAERTRATQSEPPVVRSVPRAADPVPQAADPVPQAADPVSRAVDPVPFEVSRAIPPNAAEGTAVPEQAAGAIYLPSSAVDVRADPIEEIAPEYPPEASFIAGYLVLRLFINELGTVDSIDVLISDPEGVFDAAATRAFAGARYRPAVKDGRTVKTEMVVEVKFNPPIVPTIIDASRMIQPSPR